MGYLFKFFLPCGLIMFNFFLSCGLICLISFSHVGYIIILNFFLSCGLYLGDINKTWSCDNITEKSGKTKPHQSFLVE